MSDEIIGLHLKGSFYFHGNSKSSIKGPIKKGLRLLFWGNIDTKATSCSFVKNVDINVGEYADIEIVIVSEKSIDKKIIIGDIYNIGMPQIPIGRFVVIAILGEWIGKMP